MKESSFQALVNLAKRDDALARKLLTVLKDEFAEYETAVNGRLPPANAVKRDQEHRKALIDEREAHRQFVFQKRRD